MTAVLLFAPVFAFSQVDEYLGDESALYAETKQINQFFRRFNSEEDLNGNRLYPKQKGYRDAKFRKKYIKLLFDNETSSIKNELKTAFIGGVTKGSSPEYLNLHGGDWFAKVNAKFTYKGKSENATLFLKIQEEKVGSKWVLMKVFFDPFSRLFEKPGSNGHSEKTFIHPMSHELDFMNLRKAFENKEIVEHYAAKEFKPDHLTLFLFEMKKGNLKFENISNVKFHVFQIEDWYFELSHFNRSGNNTGWLISDLLQISGEEKEKLVKYLLYED